MVFEKVQEWLEGVDIWGHSIPTSVAKPLARQYLPELIARGPEGIVDALAGTKLAAKTWKFGLGSIFGILGGLFLTGDAADDMHEVASHLVTEFADPTPEDLQDMANTLVSIREAIKFGDWKRLGRAFGVTDLKLLQKRFAAAGKSLATAFSIPKFKLTEIFGLVPKAPKAPKAPPAGEVPVATYGLTGNSEGTQARERTRTY